MASNLTQRVAFAVVAIPLALGIVYWGGWVLVALVVAVAVLGARELLEFARTRGIDPLERTALVSSAALPVLAYLALTTWPELSRTGWILAGLWVVALLSIALFRRTPDRHPLEATAVTAFAVLYPAGLATFFLALRHLSYPARS